LMLQAVHLRAISSTSSHPYLYSVQPLPQVDQATSRPSPEAISRTPLGTPLTLLKSTLAGVLASVASKGLTGMLTPLDATFTKKRGGRGILSRHATPCYGGSPEAQTKLPDRFPTKGIWLTECSGGECQKGICWRLKRISLSKLRATGDRVSFCGTSLLIRITRLIWVAAQTVAA